MFPQTFAVIIYIMYNNHETIISLFLKNKMHSLRIFPLHFLKQQMSYCKPSQLIYGVTNRASSYLSRSNLNIVQDRGE